ncbi:hypothetical protein GCM10027417_19420 [Glutamicibacter endophyticus]
MNHVGLSIHACVSYLDGAPLLVSMGLLITTVSNAGSTVVLYVSALLAGVAQGLGQLAELTLIGTSVPTSHRSVTMRR